MCIRHVSLAVEHPTAVRHENRASEGVEEFSKAKRDRWGSRDWMGKKVKIKLGTGEESRDPELSSF